MRKFTFFMAMILVFLLAAASVYAVEFPGSSWTSAGNMSTKIKGFGERLFLIQFDVHFGPQIVDLVDGGLDDEEWVLGDDSVIVVTRERLEDGRVGRVVFEGVYRIVGKNITREKPKVTMDREAIAEELDEVIIGAEGAIVEVQKAKLKVKPKSKDGQDTIKLNFLVKWTATLEDGSFIKIRQKYKGIGNPVFD